MSDFEAVPFGSNIALVSATRARLADSLRSNRNSFAERPSKFAQIVAWLDEDMSERERRGMAN